MRNDIINVVCEVADRSEYNLALKSGYVLELDYVENAKKELFYGILILVEVIILVVLMKIKKEVPMWVQKVVIILFILTLWGALRIIA